MNEPLLLLLLLLEPDNRLEDDYSRLASNIDSKSSNNTYLNIVEILLLF